MKTAIFHKNKNKLPRLSDGEMKKLLHSQYSDQYTCSVIPNRNVEEDMDSSNALDNTSGQYSQYNKYPSVVLESSSRLRRRGKGWGLREVIAVTSFLILLLFVNTASSTSPITCNEAVCASVVSKCTLLKSCDCELEATECKCCKRCFACLDYLTAECCSCVGLCPSSSSNSTIPSVETKKFSVSDMSTPSPVLWNSLTSEPDPSERWTNYPAKGIKPKKIKPISPQETVVAEDTYVSVNCTVAFLNEVYSEVKCFKSCSSMGATNARYFLEDGCCECVGQYCINYGINEPRCNFIIDDEIDYDNLSDEELRILEDEYGIMPDDMSDDTSDVTDVTQSMTSTSDWVSAPVTMTTKPEKKTKHKKKPATTTTTAETMTATETTQPMTSSESKVTTKMTLTTSDVKSDTTSKSDDATSTATDHTTITNPGPGE